jgi:hypothetical protein
MVDCFASMYLRLAHPVQYRPLSVAHALEVTKRPLKKVPATSQARDNRIPTVDVAIVFIAGSLVADNDFGRWCRQFLDFLQGGTKR